MFTLVLDEDTYGSVYKDCEIIAIELERTYQIGPGEYDYELVVRVSYGNGIKVVRVSKTYEQKELVTKWTDGFKLKMLELNKEKELTRKKILEEIEKVILIKKLGKQYIK